MPLLSQNNIKGSLLSFLVLLLMVSGPLRSAANENKATPHCHPAVNIKQPQFIVGYGSLMQEKSKHEDASDIGENHPVYITGFKRSWIRHGTRRKLNTTYLAVVKKPDAKLNAVYYQLNNPADINNYDARERGYCRAMVSPQQIQTISGESLPNGQYWIYVTKDDETTVPSKQYPIMQSYVDIFLSGCLEQEKKYHLQGFARDCINMTSGWSRHWVNDRASRPDASKNAPYTLKVDALIEKELPGYIAR